MYRSFVSLGRYTPKYFILFVAMVNGIVSLISLFVFSLFFFHFSPCSFDLIFFIAKDPKHIFIVLIGHLYILLEKCLFRSFVFFLFVCLFIWLLRVLVVACRLLVAACGI